MNEGSEGSLNENTFNNPSIDSNVAPVSANLIQNGNFNNQTLSTSGNQNWAIYSMPNAANMSTRFFQYSSNWVFDFSRNGGDQAVVFQITGAAIPIDSKLNTTLSLGNSSSVRKRITVIIHDSDWSDQQACVFWLEPSTVLKSFTMTSFTTEQWTNAQLSIYEATSTYGEWTQLDNVSLTYDNYGVGEQRETRCVHPDAPVNPATGDKVELIRNGNFSSNDQYWGINGSNSRITAGLFEFYKVTSNQYVTQDTGEFLQATEPLELSFNMGNASSMRRRVSIILHDNDWSDLQFCSFWLPSRSPMQRYVMRTYSTESWSAAEVTFYDTTDAAGSWIQLDDISLKNQTAPYNRTTTCFLEPSLPVCTAPIQDGGQTHPPSSANGIICGFRGAYYDNANFSGYMVVQNDPEIDFDWGFGVSPNGIIDPDTYSVRWTGYIRPEVGGFHTLYITTNRPTKLWVDNDLIVNVPPNHSGSYSATKVLSQGQYYYAVLEYIVAGNSGGISFEWQNTFNSRQPIVGWNNPLNISGTGTGLLGAYFPQITLGNTTTQMLPRQENVDFKWNLSAPTSSYPVDGFSGIWSGQIEAIYSETYIFSIVADDGIRLYIDDQLLIDYWIDQAPTQFNAIKYLNRGQKYNIRLEYYENTGGATLQLRWSSASQIEEVVPIQQLYPTYFGIAYTIPLNSILTIVPVTKPRLEQIAIAENIVTSATGGANQNSIGQAFEQFVLGQLSLPSNGAPPIFSAARSNATGGLHRYVLPDSIIGVDIFDLTNNTVTSYNNSSFYEVKASRCTNVTRSYNNYQIYGEIEVASLSPLGVANRPSSPPLMSFVFTSEMNISQGLINYANSLRGGLGVSLWQAHVFEIQNSNPPLLMVGIFYNINPPRGTNIFYRRNALLIPQRLNTYATIPVYSTYDETIDICSPQD